MWVGINKKAGRNGLSSCSRGRLPSLEGDSGSPEGSQCPFLRPLLVSGHRPGGRCLGAAVACQPPALRLCPSRSVPSSWAESSLAPPCSAPSGDREHGALLTARSSQAARPHTHAV